MLVPGHNYITQLDNTLCWTYNLVSNQWNTRGPLNSTKSFSPLVQFNNWIYFINNGTDEKYTNDNGIGRVTWINNLKTSPGEGACAVNTFEHLISCLLSLFCWTDYIY